jgi:hypothetical protein
LLPLSISASALETFERSVPVFLIKTHHYSNTTFGEINSENSSVKFIPSPGVLKLDIPGWISASDWFFIIISPLFQRN